MELLSGLREAFPERAKRGRPPSSLSANFFCLKEKSNKTMWWTVCKYCYAEYVNDKENFPFPIAVHGRKEAWKKHLEACERYARVTRVRRIADNCGSRDENTVADVVVSYLELYRGFNATEWCDALVDCVESRWNACEQPRFVLGYYLHPIHIAKARQLPTTVLTGLDDVCQFAQYYYRRFVHNDDSGLRGDMFAWIDDSIPAADRREFPGDNEPDFPQEKHLSGIRARKTTWHLLLVVPRELKVGSRSATLLPAEASTDKTELRKHIGCKVPRADQPNMKEAVDL
ncbi:hypothetical protein PC116_g22818 [Phytophthora cactorum]|nr:hypothetical protein PC116_g22818 [Phytophthora cactorum]